MYTINLSVVPFRILERNYLYGFINRIEICTNPIIRAISDSMFYRSCTFYKHCLKTIYSVTSSQ